LTRLPGLLGFPWDYNGRRWGRLRQTFLGIIPLLARNPPLGRELPLIWVFDSLTSIWGGHSFGPNSIRITSKGKGRFKGKKAKFLGGILPEGKETFNYTGFSLPKGNYGVNWVEGLKKGLTLKGVEQELRAF